MNDNVTNLISRLRLYNEWRRGSDDIKMPNPKEIGSDIDDACDMLEAMSDAIDRTLSDNAHLADGDNCTLIDLVRLTRDS
jgi:hypothetical protein